MEPQSFLRLSEMWYGALICHSRNQIRVFVYLGLCTWRTQVLYRFRARTKYRALLRDELLKFRNCARLPDLVTIVSTFFVYQPCRNNQVESQLRKIVLF